MNAQTVSNSKISLVTQRICELLKEFVDYFLLLKEFGCPTLTRSQVSTNYASIIQTSTISQAPTNKICSTQNELERAPNPTVLTNYKNHVIIIL